LPVANSFTSLAFSQRASSTGSPSVNVDVCQKTCNRRTSVDRRQCSLLVHYGRRRNTVRQRGFPAGDIRFTQHYAQYGYASPTVKRRAANACCRVARRHYAAARQMMEISRVAVAPRRRRVLQRASADMSGLFVRLPPVEHAAYARGSAQRFIWPAGNAMLEVRALFALPACLLRAYELRRYPMRYEEVGK